MDASQRQVAADPWTQQTDIGPQVRLHAAEAHTHRRHFIVFTQSDSRYSFYHPTVDRKLSRTGLKNELVVLRNAHDVRILTAGAAWWRWALRTFDVGHHAPL